MFFPLKQQVRGVMNWLRRVVVFTLLIGTEFSLIQSQAQQKQVFRKVDKGTILYLFQNKVFRSLNEKLEEWQQAYEQDYSVESNVFDAFEVFASADPLYEQYLNMWIQQYPTSYVPFVARAKYYCECGWMARGFKWASETSEEQFNKMERYFSLALQDIAAALKLNPQIDVCYQLMIQIAMTVSDDVLKKNALQEALKYHPYGYSVRYQYLYSLTPRWGGSYNKMEEFIELSEKYATYNPELKSLRAVIPADKADVLKREGNYDDAIQFYTKAIQYKERASYYVDRGDCYKQLEKYRQALEDYERALDLSPNNPDYLRRKSNALYGLKRFSEAQDAIEMAERLDPNNKWIQKRKEFYQSDAVKAYARGQKAVELMRSGKYEEATSELTEAIRINPNEPYYYFNRGICYLQLHEYEKSLKDLQDAVMRKRDFVKAYNALGQVEYSLGKYDEALEAVNTVIKLEPDNAEAYYNRALIFYKKGWKNEALEETRRACDMGYQSACVLRDQLKGK